MPDSLGLTVALKVSVAVKVNGDPALCQGMKASPLRALSCLCQASLSHCPQASTPLNYFPISLVISKHYFVL